LVKNRDFSYPICIFPLPSLKGPTGTVIIFHVKNRTTGVTEYFFKCDDTFSRFQTVYERDRLINKLTLRHDIGRAMHSVTRQRIHIDSKLY